MTILAEGKTKLILSDPTSFVVVKQKPRVTWGNEHEADMPGKEVWSTTTTANVFRLLEKKGVATAFIEQVAPDEFVAWWCMMIKLEVVVRPRIDPKSSYLKRNPQVQVDTPLDRPIVEFFLKSSNKVFNGVALPDDDPLVTAWDEDEVRVHHPGRPIEGSGTPVPFFVPENIPNLKLLRDELAMRAERVVIVLRDAWASLGWTLGDFKIEFGVTPHGKLLLADVIDNDSWRLRDQQGSERSKQQVRDDHKAGLPLNVVLAKASANYAFVAEMSNYLVDA